MLQAWHKRYEYSAVSSASVSQHVADAAAGTDLSVSFASSAIYEHAGTHRQPGL